MTDHQDEEVIKVGDLVAVIAGMPCGCGDSEIGRVASVKRIEIAMPSDVRGPLICLSCKKELPAGTDVYFTEKNVGYIRSQLKKLKPPPKELPAREKEKELT